MLYLQEELKKKLCDILTDEFDLKKEEIQFSIPPDRKFGDLSTTIPFVLAKKNKEKPFIIGNKIVAKIKDTFEKEMFSEIKLAGGGFLNFYFKRDFLFRYLYQNLNREVPCKNQKVVVEHTSINPNKSAHIGHLRNSCLGDTLARSLSFLGYTVEIQNYLDDTGIQVADVVWGLLNHQKKSIEEIKETDNIASELWHLYPRVSKMFIESESYKEERNEVHKKIENKIEPEYGVSNYISQEVLKDHIRVMNLLGIQYDLLVRESDIIELDFFKDVEKILKKNGILYPSEDPEKKGCWVIKYEREKIEKIVIRSNGTSTYIGKDIGYAFWKVGLFERDFYYRKFYTYNEEKKDIYITDYIEQEGTFNYGKGKRVFNVIDVRQSYLQNIIAQVLNTLSQDKSVNNYIHFSYEMVALTPRCVKELGFEVPEEDQKKTYLEVSGRKGIAVKADDLIDKLTEKSSREVEKRNPGIEKSKLDKIARDIAIGALRYFMVKFSSTSVIAFDFKNVLAFEGDTGPYLQYSLVRINSILRKLELAMNLSELKSEDLNILTLDKITEKEHTILYDILLTSSLLETQVELALNNHELSVIANYTYNLCQKFNHYYHLFPVVSEEDPEIQKMRIQFIFLVKNKLEKLLGMMGIPIPEKM